MRDSYDCIVVGGGPGGAWAAKYAAESGASVLLLEKDREIGVPVRCAEAAGENGLKLVVEPDPRWITTTIENAVLVSPHGREVVLESGKERGYMLDRKIFDYDLVQIATTYGVEVLTKAYVYDLIKPNGRVEGVRVQHLGSRYDIRAQVVIGADGVESRVGRWGGLRTNIKMKDMESCIQMTLANLEVDSKTVYFYFGREVAPGGYLWVFPKNDRVANVGLGISGEYARYKSAKRYLQEFIDKQFPHAAVLYTVVGGVPCAATLKKIVADGLMLVGDAAHQVNPISGGGIVTAMIAGQMAGKVAADAIKENDVSEKRLQEYANEWHRVEGKNHERFYKIKKAIYKLTDEDLNRTADTVLSLPSEKRTIINIFKAALVKNPSLIFDVIKVFMKN
ncbi:NAD(P)/FAD-dependent oxidoreductase [candidate division KSB1 bacterium]|nr:NAD(P)/FAD-dependent oxidoreductase [candidate division KSB1 bacterium]NIR72145.1 NAD(P)/FAD-dependent oxidoreductase [candidate division KSB1 bacterium]NIS26610.1 NAD(P)/FAD-dependent oxidoreductase [candidate division KSB1 bacterium]NIT73378.1 NAD(P)/FAD-dependent oxidoreductase [candidate division KSB1 bacterium]NIU27226.1 NAD(P)/FAD-dependent oxidoreductase [candidate division KSB1 bacterium]